MSSSFAFSTPPKDARPSATTATAAKSTAAMSSPPFSPSTPPPPPPPPLPAENDVAASSPYRDDFEEERELGQDQEDGEDQEADEQEEEEEEPPEWEDFMARYWQLGDDDGDDDGDGGTKFQIASDARQILLREDTDLRPVAMDPILEEEKALESYETNMPLDMDLYHLVVFGSSEGGGNASPSFDEMERSADDRCDAPWRKGWERGILRRLLEEGDEGGNGLDRIGAPVQQQQKQQQQLEETTEASGGKTMARRNSAEKPTRRPEMEEREKRYLEEQSTATNQPSTQQLQPQSQNMQQPMPQSQNMQQPIQPQPQPQQQKQPPVLTSNRSRSFDARSDVPSETSSGAAIHNHIHHHPHPNNSTLPKTMTPLPSPCEIHATGPIQTRTSLRSLVMKKWNSSHWMHYGPHTLLIFRSRDHMDDWRHNPYHGKKQREYLVKLKIDFYADMMTSSSSSVGGGDVASSIGRSGSIGGGSSVGSVEDGTAPGSGAAGVLGHRILPIKKKSYGKNEPEMYQFKLERWTNIGVTVVAAFGSQDEREVQVLHKTITEILKTCPYGGLRNIDHMLKK